MGFCRVFRRFCGFTWVFGVFLRFLWIFFFGGLGVLGGGSSQVFGALRVLFVSLSCASGQGFRRFVVLLGFSVFSYGFGGVFRWFLRFFSYGFLGSFGVLGSWGGLPMVFSVFPTVSWDLFLWSWGLGGGAGLEVLGVLRWFFRGFARVFRVVVVCFFPYFSF